MKKVKMNKKGFLLAEETIKMLIALICLAFLIYFLVSLYMSKTGGEKIKEAQDTLDRIKEVIASLPEGQTQTQDIINPAGWHLISFPVVSDEGEESELPNSCAGGICLCICADAINLIQKQSSRCDKKGACINIDNLETKNLNIKIEGADELKFIGIKKENALIYIGEVKQ